MKWMNLQQLHIYKLLVKHGWKFSFIKLILKITYEIVYFWKLVTTNIFYYVHQWIHLMISTFTNKFKPVFYSAIQLDPICFVHFKIY